MVCDAQRQLHRDLDAHGGQKIMWVESHVVTVVLAVILHLEDSKNVAQSCIGSQ